MLDASYDALRIAHLLSGLPVEVLGRTRSDRAMRRPVPSREELFRAPEGRPDAQARRGVRLRRLRHLGR